MLKDKPAPGLATANAVAETIKRLKTMMGNVLCKHYDVKSISNYDTAYGATTDDSSIETKSQKSYCTCTKCKETDNDVSTKTRKKLKKKKEKEKKKNDCPHCKRYHHHHPHPNVPKEKCFWNKKVQRISPQACLQ